MPYAIQHRRLVPKLIVAAVLSGWLVPVTASPAGAQAVNGRIEQVGPFRVLRVWGTPEEMGFAHGQLMADAIVHTLSDAFAAVPEQQRAAYDQGKSLLLNAVELPDRVRAELTSMMKGIRAAQGSTPVLASLGRALRLEDLILRNSEDMLRAFGCSGYTAWGDKTGSLGVVTSRNFDFPVPSRRTLEAQMILVREPAGRRKVMTVTWPGYIGAFTGVNEDGVCAFMHDGTGGRQRHPDGKFPPLALVLADVLERAEPAGALAITETSLKAMKRYPFSYMVRIVTPTVDGSVPTRVFRIDSGGVGENSASSFSCITTNHYLPTSGLSAVIPGDSTIDRYRKLEKNLAHAVTPSSAWRGLRTVAFTNQRHPTLHSLVVYPDQRRLDLAFGRWKQGQVEPAAFSAGTTISFEQVFGP